MKVAGGHIWLHICLTMQQPTDEWKKKSVALSLLSIRRRRAGFSFSKQDERWMYDSAEKETVAETYFRYHGESQKIAHETHYGYEDLSPVTLPEEVRI